MSALDDAFAKAKVEGRAVLIGYLPAGFPTREGCIEALVAMVEGGVDVVEVGLPYTDPLMDGPVIQAAVQCALDAKVGTRDVLDTVRAVVDRTGAPTLVMTYWNPVDRFGADAFAAALAAVGGAGVITPDLLPEEAVDWLAATSRHDVAPVFVVAPSSGDARLARIGALNRGFVYAASTMGVTGVRASVGNRAAELVQRLRAVTSLPVAVGLGVSTGEQAAEVAGYAEGVVVGSAFVARLLDAPDAAAGVVAVRELAEELAAGVRRPTRLACAP